MSHSKNLGNTIGDIDTDVTAIKVKTDTIPTDPATNPNVDDVDTNVTNKHTTTDALIGSKHTTTDALIGSKHTTTDSKIDVIDGLQDVPLQDTADNNNLRDVIGNKTDTFFGTSLMSGLRFQDIYISFIEEHLHSVSQIYPYLANPIQLQKAAGAWAAMPTPTEIVPVNVITSDFDLHFAVVDTISANGNYVITFYQGLAGAETIIGSIAVSRNAVLSQEGSIPICTPVINANSRISASLSSGNAAQDTLNVKVFYHVY